MTLILYATPAFLLLILIELIVDHARRTGYYRLNDSFASLVLGITSRSSALILFGIGIYATRAVLDFWQLPVWPSDTWWAWVVTFVAYDLTYYWSHRAAHEINFWWAGHVIHHQSEEFNLTTALRQTSTSVLVFVFSLPLLMLGSPPDVLVACAALNLIYQFWVHTRFVGKLGWMEKIFITPSHHRVHHGQNKAYIDRNHGGVFIFWDKLFGTFQEELDDDPPIYGVRYQNQALDPLRANFQVWALLIRDAWRAASWWDKLRIWFMPTGWRPADVAASYPLVKTDLGNLHKFDPPSSAAAKRYALLQLVAAYPANVLLLLWWNGQPYLQVLFVWVLVTAPLVTTAFLLEGRWWQLEVARLLSSWAAFALVGAVLGATLWWAALAYLLVSTVLLVDVVFDTLRRPTPERQVA